VTSVVSSIAFPSGLDATGTVCARSSVPHPSHEHQHRARFRASTTIVRVADRLGNVRYLALLVLAVVFLTGLVWWVVFIGNAVARVFRRE
jgi:hypothetical protein